MTIDPAVSPVPAAPGRARAAAFPLLAVLLVVALAPASPAVAFPHTPQQAKLALAADRIAYDAGTTARLRARVTIATGWHVNSHQPTFDYLIPTALTLKLPAGWPPAKITYPAAQLRKFAFAEVPLAVYDGDALILAELAVPKGAAVGTYPVHAALFYQACNHDQCLPPVTAEADLPLKVGPGGRLVAALGGASAPRQRPPVQGLPLILALGLLGGLLLNVMPCVLPVLSLKIFGLVRSAGHGRAEVIRGALATAAGILISFWALAVTAIAARAAGLAVGWGVQFQRPGFVAFLALVVVLFCLNLWGLFEIPLPQRLARLGAIGASGARGPREGLAGHFASGLFATLMATPCSAPFLGTAVGFALAQEAPAILATFTAVGVGMALPYLLLAVAPASTRLLPRPGAWMEAVRGVMGFLLAAAAVWLFYVLAAQVSPERVALIELALLGMALFTWLHRRGALAAAGGERGAGLRRFAAAGMAAAALATVLIAAGPNGGAGPGARTAEKSAGLIPWVSFDRARAESLSAAGTLVFVDVTADWCFTCKVNERLVLDTPEVAQAFREQAVVPMRADWTNRNDEIGAFLAEHGRYGIPFYLLYRPGAEPYVFSELPSKARLIAAVRGSARKVAEAAPR